MMGPKENPANSPTCTVRPVSWEARIQNHHILIECGEILSIQSKRDFMFVCLFNLFLTALGLCCCTWAFSSCSERGLLLIAVRGLLIAVASLVVEQGL